MTMARDARLDLFPGYKAEARCYGPGSGEPIRALARSCRPEDVLEAVGQRSCYRLECLPLGEALSENLDLEEYVANWKVVNEG